MCIYFRERIDVSNAVIRLMKYCVTPAEVNGMAFFQLRIVGYRKTRCYTSSVS
ncbi:hypothetical protein [Sulfobacillus sp. hq2]|uniref:hypothetical protein n=1 Tax=Sulfobacillus TaxID=28033 RepID=UPI001304DB3C|nr:hypothetical protein [Sulfobacillus sp. hq2]MCY0907054.1 hypothetical protein [Sulfobacillus thermotolerans]